MPKSPEMERMLEGFTQSAFGRSRKDRVDPNTGKILPSCCVTCGSDKTQAHHFRDPLSRREFEISKMCQHCQDETFTPDDEDEEE